MKATTAKARPRLGDECWFVQWTYELVWIDGDSTSEYREIDRDNCKERTRRVATKAEAERLAREVYPETVGVFGFVEYWHAVYEAYDDNDGTGPYLAHWEPTGDPATYEGEG
jgi:hypothetical protein